MVVGGRYCLQRVVTQPLITTIKFGAAQAVLGNMLNLPLIDVDQDAVSEAFLQLGY